MDGRLADNIGMELHKALNFSLPAERCWTIPEIARELHLSHKSTHHLFVNEEGVIVISNPKPHKRIYRTLRVPDSVKQRRINRLKNKGGR
jgi:hypothetical protein